MESESRFPEFPVEVTQEHQVPIDLHTLQDCGNLVAMAQKIDAEIERMAQVKKRASDEKKRLEGLRDKIKKWYSPQLVNLDNVGMFKKVGKQSAILDNGCEVKFTNHKKKIATVGLKVEPEKLLHIEEYAAAVIVDIIPSQTVYKVDNQKLKDILESEYNKDGTLPREELFTYTENPDKSAKF